MRRLPRKHRHPIRMTSAIFHEHIFPQRHKLFRFALRITGSRHEAEDVVQEVLEKVWKAPAEQSAGVQNWEAWCMTLTRNRSLDKTRSQTLRRTASLEGSVAQFSGSDNLHQSAENRDLVDRVRQQMQLLPEKQRLVMHLRDIEEMSYDEIAQTLQISLEQVKVNLHRARKSIREHLLTEA